MEALRKTALGMAVVQAEETKRPDRLFTDPLAGAFVAAAPGVFNDQQEAARAGENEALATLGAVFSTSAVLRTKFFDDFLLAACGQGRRQVVLLGAGLDARAFRVEWPAGTALFEIDLPDVLEFKNAVLADQSETP